MKYAILLCVVFLALTGCGGGGGGDASGTGGGGGPGPGAGGGGGGATPFGLDARVAASGLQIPISPAGSSQLTAVNAFPNVSIPGPTYMTNAGDGSNRLFVTDRNGVIWVFNNASNSPQATTFLDISDRVDDNTGEGGMLGLVFDPNFSSNGYFYVSYVTPANATTANRKVRLSQFRVTTSGANVANGATERIVFEYDHPEGYHFGGWIGFGPELDKYTLYMSTGDGGNQREVQLTDNLFGKILRIRIDAGNATYTVPSDNPFGATNPVWALGFRNPWRCSFDRGNGNMWCGDVGESDREEVNFVKKGKNYGWPFFEGDRPYVDAGTKTYSDYEPAVYQYPHTVGVAVIGGFVYRGSALPSLVGRYLFSDFLSPNVWALQADSSGNFIDISVAATNLGDGRSFGEDEAGEVYALVGNGPIYRFQESGGGGGGATMPSTLSGTGLFSDTAALTPAPFLIDYTVNAPFWSDGSTKRRWFVLPNNQTIGFAADGAWSFPVGTITVKHFELPLAAGGTTRVETRVMVHRTDGWIGFTYRWRANQQDADLITNGASASYETINPATNTPVTLTWNFPSQAQCLNCHTQATGRVLGLNTLQFNGNHTYAATGRSDNQLRTLNHIGVFSQDIGAASQYGAQPNPADASAALDARARSYLETNCSICHRPNGPTPVNMDLRYTTPLADTRLVGVANEGSVSGVRIVAGNHANSLLWQRASSSDSNVRMPPLSVSMLDEQALQLLAGWIDSLQ
jgi:uncharacterized repeat protein (TIGR03806 family)